MKSKVAVMALLVGLASTAWAEDSVTVGYGWQKTTAGVESRVPALSFKKGLTDTFAIDYSTNTNTTVTDNKVTTRNELGLNAQQAITSSVTGSVRVAHGWKQASGSEQFRYYVVEPAVSTRVLNTPVSVKYAYRYRDAFNSIDHEHNITNRLQASYDLTKVDKVSLGRDFQRGDGANRTTQVAYTRSF
jgi:opacity protein-like surface antigen